MYPNAFGSPYYGVHRVPLLKLLAEGLDPDRDPSRLTVSWTRARRVVAFRRMDSRRCADVVVAADGVHSAVRRALRFGGAVGVQRHGRVSRLGARSEMPSLPEPSAIQFWAGPRRPPAALSDRRRARRSTSWRSCGPRSGQSETWMRNVTRRSRPTFRGLASRGGEMVGAVAESARWALHDHSSLSAGRSGAWCCSAMRRTPCCPTRVRAPTRQSRTRSHSRCTSRARQRLARGGVGALRGPAQGRTARVQAYSRRAVDVLHLATDDVDRRDVAFDDVPAHGLAWIHGHDARRHARSPTAAGYRRWEQQR